MRKIVATPLRNHFCPSPVLGILFCLGLGDLSGKSAAGYQVLCNTLHVYSRVEQRMVLLLHKLFLCGCGMPYKEKARRETVNGFPSITCLVRQCQIKYMYMDVVVHDQVFPKTVTVNKFSILRRPPRMLPDSSPHVLPLCVVILSMLTI